MSLLHWPCPLLTGKTKHDNVLLAGATFLVEIAYKVTAIYVLACVVFLRKKKIQTAVVSKCIFMPMQVRYSRGSSSQWQSSREVCVCIQQAELMWTAQQRAEIDSVAMSAVTPEKQVWNWVIALSIPCCFTNSYSCDNFPADVPKKIVCKLSFTLCDRKSTDRSSWHSWDPYKEWSNKAPYEQIFTVQSNFLKKVKISEFWVF